MIRSTVRLALRTWWIALALPMAGIVVAGDAAGQAPKARQADEELSEVVVEATRKRAKTPSFQEYQSTFDFMARLVGRFVVDGVVDVHASGNGEDNLPASGRVECIGFGEAPAVQCEFKVRWPEYAGPGGRDIIGGVSTLDPAMMLFGFEPLDPNTLGRKKPLPVVVFGVLPNGPPPPPPDLPDTPEEPGISYVMVDSKGFAELAVGQMLDANTMRSRSRCQSIPGDCERVVRITAAPDLRTVSMNIDLVVDGHDAVAYAFVMHRVPDGKAVVYGRKPGKESKAAKKK